MSKKTYEIKTGKITEITECLSIANILNDSFRRYEDKFYWLKNWQGLSNSAKGFINKHLTGAIR